MTPLRLRRTLVRWGDAYGIRVTRKEAERLGLHERDTVSAEISPEPQGIRVDRLTPLRLGRDASRLHDRLAAEAADAGR